MTSIEAFTKPSQTSTKSECTIRWTDNNALLSCSNCSGEKTDGGYDGTNLDDWDRAGARSCDHRGREHSRHLASGHSYSHTLKLSKLTQRLSHHVALIKTFGKLAYPLPLKGLWFP